MIQIKKFTETDFEFRELARIDNLVNHDSINHPDDDKNDWKIRDRGQIRNRLLLYKNNILIGAIYYSQGKDENRRTTFYTLNLDPTYNNNGYRSLLYNKMLMKMVDSGPKNPINIVVFCPHFPHVLRLTNTQDIL